MACAGSVALPSPPDESSEFADEGTAAHTLASWCLDSGFNAAKFRDAQIHVHNDDKSIRRTFTVDEDMADYVQVYVDAIRDRVHDDAQLFVEQKLNTGIESKRYGKITGTGDAIIMVPSARRLEIHDLKYGRGVKVFAKDNPQLMLYGLGGLHDYSWMSDVDEVLVAIHQPRLDHYCEHPYKVSELNDFEAALKARVAQLDAGATDEVPGDHCKFCPRKVQCKALEKVADDFLADFPDVSDLTEHGIGAAMDKVELVETRCAAVRQEARRLLDAGTKVPGWTLEEGRAGNRKWADDKQMEANLSLVVGDAAYKPRALISPADAEKKLAKKNPTLWANLQAHIVRGAPSINMVRDDGNRKPYAASSLDDFKVIQ
jgi:hypothetical protein